MLIFKRQEALRAHLKSISDPTICIGFVPTMGALHQGHLSLLKESVNNNTITIVSIFVNPTQFNNTNDLINYPRTLEDDIAKIKTVNDSILVYAPPIEDIYEGKPVSEHFDFDGLENQMEGKFRVGHFDGVGTIVKRLFEIINPTNAYFGEKDFQQLQIIKKLVLKYDIAINIIGCAIYRESNGLAMSSRNERLSQEEKEEAQIIFKTLSNVKIKFGVESAENISDWVENIFEGNSSFKLDYFQIADETDLLPCLTKDENKKYRAFIAVFVNNIRLIDTISLN